MSDSFGDVDRSSGFFLLVGLLLAVAVFIHCAATDEGMTAEVSFSEAHATSPDVAVDGLCAMALVAGALGVAGALLRRTGLTHAPRSGPHWSATKPSMMGWFEGRDLALRLCVIQL